MKIGGILRVPGSHSIQTHCLESFFSLPRASIHRRNLNLIFEKLAKNPSVSEDYYIRLNNHLLSLSHYPRHNSHRDVGSPASILQII